MAPDAFLPPVLPYPVSVASLCGRRPVVFDAADLACRFRFVAPCGPATGAPGEWLRFRVDGNEGRLLLSAAIVKKLVQAVEPAPLGQHDPPTAALLLELALADALNTLEAASGGSFALLACGPDKEFYAGHFRVGVDLLVGETTCAATLSLPPATFERLRRLVVSVLPPDPPAPAPPALLGVRIGVSWLAANVVASLRPGDALIPDVLLAPAEGLLVIGERLAALGRLDGTRLVLDNVPSPITAEWEDWIVSSEGSGIGSESGPGAADIAPEEAGFGALRVTLVFELGRRTMPMSEVVGLAAGHVIELGPVEGATVSVLANGARLGRGEFVRVGDALAIRLTEIGTTR